MAFEKATKKKSKLRLAVFGPSGSGKTYSALRIATGLGDKIAVIDTERGSASKYSDRFAFDVCELDRPDIGSMIATLADAKEYGVLIIDSMTHSWQELIEDVEKIAKAKYHGNTWSAWSEGTPKQKEFIDALLRFPGHIIATMRSKTEWTTEKSDNGKNRPVRLGLAPEQGKNIEYEFDMLLEINQEHFATVIKDRTGKYQDVSIDKPGEALGKELAEWLGQGSEPKPEPEQEPTKPKQKEDTKPKKGGMTKEQAERIKDLRTALGLQVNAVLSLITEEEAELPDPATLTALQCDMIIQELLLLEKEKMEGQI